MGRKRAPEEPSLQEQLRQQNELIRSVREELRSLLPQMRGDYRTVSQLAEDWLPGKLASIVSPKTFEGRVRNHLLPILGHHTAQTLKKRHVEALLRGLLASGLSPQTTNHIRDAGRQLVEDAIDNDEWPAANPFAKTKQIPIPEADKDVLTRDEARRLLLALAAHWRPLFALAIYLGPRRSTIFHVRPQDVDLEKRTITFQKTKTGKRIKAVPIPDELFPYIVEAYGSGSADWLFVNRNGRQHKGDCKSLIRVLRRAFKDAGIVRRNGILPDITFHGLRRVSSVLHQEAGCHPWVVSKVLGHSQASLALVGSMTENMTAKRYSSYTDGFVRQELNKLSLK